jgi:2-keto-4-pentenoate hydratase
VVLGEFRQPWPDLATATGVVSLDGKDDDSGTGRDVLGHPFNSVAWVAQHLAESGEGLRAGDIVMTGNWVTTKFPKATSRFGFAVQGLGAVALTIRM